MVWQEDDVIGVAVAALRGASIRVIASGGNQATTCSFRLPNGRRKAPDIVGYKSDTIFAFEAKVTVAALFRAGKGGVSDVDAIRHATFGDGATMVRASAREIARALGDELAQDCRVVGGVVAGQRFTETALQVINDLVVIEAHPDGHVIMRHNPDAVLPAIVGREDVC